MRGWWKRAGLYVALQVDLLGGGSEGWGERSGEEKLSRLTFSFFSPRTYLTYGLEQMGEEEEGVLRNGLLVDLLWPYPWHYTVYLTVTHRPTAGRGHGRCSEKNCPRSR